MGDFEYLTIIFTILKLTDNIDWSWWLVMSPIIFKLLLLVAVLGYTFIREYYDRSKS
jgi:hypothetical protein